MEKTASLYLLPFQNGVRSKLLMAEHWHLRYLLMDMDKNSYPRVVWLEKNRFDVRFSKYPSPLKMAPMRKRSPFPDKTFYKLFAFQFLLESKRNKTSPMTYKKQKV